MAMTFNGSTGYLESSTLPVASATYPITVLCMFNVVNTTATHTLFSLDNSASNRRIMVQADGTIGGDPIIAYAFDTAGNQSQTAGSFLANTWHQGGGIFTSNASRTAILDSVLATPQTTARSSSWNRVKIGARYNSGVGAYCNGSIANLGVWNVVLTQDEITAHFRGVSCNRIRPSALQLWVPGIRDRVDLGRNNIPWTVNGTVTVGDHCRVYG